MQAKRRVETEKLIKNVPEILNLYYFQKKLNAKHAFQVTLDMDYINKDCFTYQEPVIVSIKTFLSQLV